jgi:hypothetical protein
LGFSQELVVVGCPLQERVVEGSLQEPYMPEREISPEDPCTSTSAEPNMYKKVNM